MPDESFPSWLDKTGFGVIGKFTLDDGEQIVAEIVDFNDVTNEHTVQAISSSGSREGVKHSTHAIPIDRVLSFDVESRASQPWPHSDPCLDTSFSGPRFTLMATMFLSWTVGSLALFVVFMNGDPYRLQELSAISYTIFEAFFTFAAVSKGRPYMFTCPAVTPQLPALLWRHLGFLISLFTLQTAALTARLSLPDWWNLRDSRGSTPLELVLLLLCMSLGYIQVFTNRKLLQRAHSQFIA